MNRMTLRMTRRITRRILPLFLAFLTAAAAGAQEHIATKEGAPQPAKKEPGRLDGVAALLVSRDAAGARKRIQEALELYRKEGNRAQEAVCQLLLGLTETTVRNEDAARVHLSDSITIFETVHEPLGAWFAALTLAQMEHQQTHYDRAAAAYEKSLAILQKAAEPGEPFSLEILRSLPGAFDVDLGLEDLPIELPPDIVKPFLIQLLEIPARTGYAGVLIDVGELKKAEEQLARVKGTMFTALFEGVILTREGELLTRQGRLDEAREKYRQALSASPATPVWGPGDAQIEDAIYGKLAQVEMLAGRVDDAVAWYDKAIAAVRAAKNSVREPWIIRERADLLFRSSRLDAAEATLREALATADRVGDLVCRAVILTDLGVLDIARGRYGSAVAHYEKSLEALQTAKKPFEEAYTWIMLSNVYTLADDAEKSRVAIRKARTLAESSDLPYFRHLVTIAEAGQQRARGEISQLEYDEIFGRAFADPTVRGSMIPADFWGRIVYDGLSLATAAPLVANLPMVPATVYMFEGKRHLERGELETAREMWRKGLALQPSRDLRAGFLMLLGTYAGSDAEGARYFAQAAEAVEETLAGMPSDDLVASYLGGHAFFYFAGLVDLLIRQECVADAFDVTEQARARAFLQLVGRTRLRPRGGADAPLAAEAEALRTEIIEWERQSLVTTGEAGRPVRAKLSEARSRYAELLQRLKASAFEYASLTAVRPAGIENVRAALPADTTLVSYFGTGARLHVWLVDRSGVQHVTVPATESELARIACWAGSFGPEDGAARGVIVNESECAEAATATAEEVHDLLFAPLRDRIANRRLIIVPHGVLHYVPFAALRNGRTGRYLVEDYSITYAPSASSLRFLREKETPVEGTALVLGDPAAPTGAELPYAREEAARVAEALGTVAAVGAEATESRLYALGGKVDLVHIAAHAFYDRQHPLFSRVALAGGDGRDGNLDVHDILAELDLTGVNLVVLAACDSAAGRQSGGGDDVVGLTWALLYAGTPGVISTLWKIQDDATAALMDDFYCRLLAGDTPADALRIAQLSMLHGDAWSDPELWAAFTLTGNPLGRWNGTAGHGASGARSPQ